MGAKVKAMASPEAPTKASTSVIRQGASISTERKQGNIDTTGIGDPFQEWESMRLTWAGHAFIDSARSESVWRTARTLVQQNGLSIGFDVLMAVMRAFAKKLLSHP